ncbi:MAG: hypothetical protein HY787_21525 [Deltaproteobacteria bacterium]|nr:hypothetical protein [Deltaproteobacteria bacterium]
MNDWGCEYCQELCLEVKIITPGEIAKAIAVVRDNLKDATIIESSYWPEQVLRIDNPPFGQVPEKGPWPDVMIYYFQCSRCGQLFRLSAETYHGSGGEWKPVQKGNP